MVTHEGREIVRIGLEDFQATALDRHAQRHAVRPGAFGDAGSELLVDEHGHVVARDARPGSVYGSQEAVEDHVFAVAHGSAFGCRGLADVAVERLGQPGALVHGKHEDVLSHDSSGKTMQGLR